MEHTHHRNEVSPSSSTRAPRTVTSRLVVIPVRSFAVAKTRLHEIFDDAERHRLAEACATQVLANLGADRTIVVGDSPDVLQWSADHAVTAMAVTARGLNAALDEAILRIWAQWQPDDIIVVHGDLVFPEALSELDDWMPSIDGDRVVAIPDRHDDGTNVLGISAGLVDRWRFRYGANSYQAHRAQAHDLGARFSRIDHADLGVDLDTPADLTDARVRARVASLLAMPLADLDRRLQ